MDLDMSVDAAQANVEKKHIKRLETLEQDYLKVFFEMQSNEKWHSLKKVVKMPPQVPRQSDESSCGVFMLQFARCETEKVGQLGVTMGSQG